MRVDISPKNRVQHMTALKLQEAHSLVVDLIGQQPPGSKLKSIFPGLARKLDMTERRVRAIWNNEHRSIGAHEMDQLRRLKAEAETKARRHADLNEAARLEALAARLLRENPEDGGRLADPYLRAARAYRIGFEEVK